MAILFHPRSSALSPARSGLGVALLMALLCAAPLAVLIVMKSAVQSERSAHDEQAYHLPTIEQFAREWPAISLRDYPSATTPGYHLVLAMVQRCTGVGLTGLRVAGAGFTIGLLGTLGWAVGRQVRGSVAVPLCLPLIASVHVLSSGARLLPDNAGWWGVLGILLIAGRPRCDRWTLAAGGAALLGLVLVRQVHLWAAAVLVIGAWVDPVREGAWGNPSVLTPGSHRRRRFVRVGLMLLACLPSVAVVGAFFHLWHGSVPPSAQDFNTGGNLAMPALSLAVLGIVGVFYAGFLSRHRPALRRARRWIIGAACAGAAAALIPPTDYNIDAGRYSGIWNIVQRMPAIAHRSPLMIVLAALGGAVLAAWAIALPRRDRWLWLTAWLAFMVAHMAAYHAYQRYVEPFALLTVALAAARSAGIVTADEMTSRGSPPTRWAIAGPLILTAGLAAISMLLLR